MVTRSQCKIIKPKPKYVLITMLCGDIPCNPHNIHFAIAHPGWKVSMCKELEALHENVFKSKLKLDRFLDCLKARLVSKGYPQINEVNYTKTFSLVIKSNTI
uniref:Uncharacterized protein n=1 Tax=Cajanus cajan TaxID=3821 RepID=A0A151U1E8_CAJCA|nr:hypothetical protein KK1_005766 [Cajanus cajan]